jgi:hypothetical protein
MIAGGGDLGRHRPSFFRDRDRPGRHGLPRRRLWGAAGPPARPPDGIAAPVRRWIDAWGDPEDDIAVAVGEDGSLTVSGAAVGTNGHVCSPEETAVDTTTRSTARAPSPSSSRATSRW